MKKIKWNWKIGILPLYAAIIFVILSFLNFYTTTDVEKMYLTPIFDDARGWEIYTLENDVKTNKTTQELFDSSGETFYLSRVLDAQMEQDGYTIVELDGRTWQQSVFLDGNLLYTVDPTLDNRIGNITFPKEYTGIQRDKEYIRFSLPPNYGGKTLTIALAFNTAFEYQEMPMIRISSEAIQTKLLVSDANHLTMPATAYMGAAILLLGLFFFNLYHGQKSLSILLLMATSIIQSLRVLQNYEFYFNAQYSLNFIPSELLVPLSLAMPLIYLFTQMERWKKWYAPFIFIPLGISILFHLLAKSSTFFFLSYYPYDAILYLSLLSFFIFAILEWKNKNIIYRLYTPLLLVVILCMLCLILGYILTGNENATIITMLRAPIFMMYDAFQFYGGVLLILSGTVSFISTVKNAADTKSALSILSIKNELMNANIQMIQDSSTEIAILRHDMLRHLHMLMDLQHDGDMDRMEKYLKELTKETEEILPLKVCSHPIINAIITRSLAQAKKENIHIDLHVGVPNDIPIADNDLCTILKNMLDNAIEGVSNLPSEKNIELTMRVKGGYLFIETINPYLETITIDKKSNLPTTTKGEGHGYGMKAMAEVAKKYNSKIQVKLENHMIIVRTALLMPPDKKNATL